MIEVVYAADGRWWLDLLAPTSEDLATLARDHSIPEALLRSLATPGLLPSVRHGRDVVMMIVRAFDDRGPKEADDYRGLTRQLGLLAHDGLLVTIHRRKLRFLKPLKRAVREGRLDFEPRALLLEIALASTLTLGVPLDGIEQSLEALSASSAMQRRDTARWNGLLLDRVRVLTVKRLAGRARDAMRDEASWGPCRTQATGVGAASATLAARAERLAEEVEATRAAWRDRVDARERAMAQAAAQVALLVLPMTVVAGAYGVMLEPSLASGAPFPSSALWTGLTLLVAGLVFWFSE
jgi:Mg2+ and Co2+ transporter CorA